MPRGTEDEIPAIAINHSWSDIGLVGRLYWYNVGMARIDVVTGQENGLVCMGYWPQ